MEESSVEGTKVREGRRQRERMEIRSGLREGDSTYLIFGLSAVEVNDGDEEDAKCDIFDHFLFLLENGIEESFTHRSGVVHVAED